MELGLDVREVARYWSRDGSVGIDQVATLGDGTLLLGECKWSSQSPIGTGVYASLRAKVEGLPNAGWKRDARFILYSVGGFTDDLRALAEGEGNTYLIDGGRLF